MSRTAVVLDGPIGAGKTTLGRALATRLGWGFVDGDDHKRPDRTWVGSILTTSRAIVAAGLEALERHDGVVIAYPLTCKTWLFHHSRFGEAGVRLTVIGLRADVDGILATGRGRAFDAGERARIAEMVREGYGARPFADAVVASTGRPFEGVVDDLEGMMRTLLPRGEPSPTS